MRQVPEEPKRRWFADDYFDLIVWLGRKAEIIGFQLCYDKEGDERSLTWHKDSGFSHNRIDSGELERPYKATPILLADGPFDYAAVARLFEERSRTMDARTAKFVLDRIGAYPTAAEDS